MLKQETLKGGPRQKIVRKSDGRDPQSYKAPETEAQADTLCIKKEMRNGGLVGEEEQRLERLPG